MIISAGWLAQPLTERRVILGNRQSPGGAREEFRLSADGRYIEAKWAFSKEFEPWLNILGSVEPDGHLQDWAYWSNLVEADLRSLLPDPPSQVQPQGESPQMARQLQSFIVAAVSSYPTTTDATGTETTKPSKVIVDRTAIWAISRTVAKEELVRLIPTEYDEDRREGYIVYYVSEGLSTL